MSDDIRLTDLLDLPFRAEQLLNTVAAHAVTGRPAGLTRAVIEQALREVAEEGFRKCQQLGREYVADDSDH